VKPEITWDAPLESNSVSTSATFELKACIKARDLKTVQLYLNGQQVGLNKGWSLEDNCSQSLQTKISLKAGTNTTYIVATNDAGKTQSVVRTIQYQTPTPTPAPMPTPTPVPSPTTANYYALVIGVQDYTDVSIADLQHPISDGERLKTVLLDKYTFLPNNIFNLKNPTKQDLVTALERLQKTITSKDYLLIFYSGHGTMQGEEGYWMLSDAQSTTTYHWLSSSELNTYIKRFKAKHILLISDACYSGSLLMRSAESAIQQQTCAVLEATPSRFAMTSGAKTVVPDNSVFMTYLLKQLLENRQTCISAEQVYMNIKNPIILNSPNQQIPQFGNIHATGSEGGGFIFKLK
jgi:hypothetical protein